MKWRQFYSGFFILLLTILIQAFLFATPLKSQPVQTDTLRQTILHTEPGDRWGTEPRFWARYDTRDSLRTVSLDRKWISISSTKSFSTYKGVPEGWEVRESDQVGLTDPVVGNVWYTLYHEDEALYSFQRQDDGKAYVGLCVEEGDWALEYVRIDGFNAARREVLGIDVVINGKSLRDSLGVDMVYGFHWVNHKPFYFTSEQGWHKWHYGNQSSRERWWYIRRVHPTAYRYLNPKVVVDFASLRFLGWRDGNWEVIRLDSPSAGGMEPVRVTQIGDLTVEEYPVANNGVPLDLGDLVQHDLMNRLFARFDSLDSMRAPASVCGDFFPRVRHWDQEVFSPFVEKADSTIDYHSGSSKEKKEQKKQGDFAPIARTRSATVWTTETGNRWQIDRVKRDEGKKYNNGENSSFLLRKNDRTVYQFKMVDPDVGMFDVLNMVLFDGDHWALEYLYNYAIKEEDARRMRRIHPRIIVNGIDWIESKGFLSATGYCELNGTPFATFTRGEGWGVVWGDSEEMMGWDEVVNDRGQGSRGWTSFIKRPSGVVFQVRSGQQTSIVRIVAPEVEGE